MIIPPGAVSQSITVQIVDDSGLAVTGLVAATFPTTSYERVAEALVGISLSDLAALASAYSSGGVKEVGGGYYRLDVPDAAFATASKIRIVGEAANKHILYPVITCAYLQSDVEQWKGAVAPSNTGDPFARIGAAGAGLTALGDARIANLDAAVSSRSTFAGGAVASVTADVGITQAGADKVWGTTTRSLTDKIGFALSVAGVQAIWDAATSALTTAGSIGKRIVDFITTLVYAAPSTPPTVQQIRSEIDSNSIGLAEANADLDEIITSLAAIQTITWPLVAVTGTPTSTSVQVTGLTETTANAYRDGYFLLQTGDHEFTVPSPISASSYSGSTTTLTFATALVVVPSAGDTALIIGSKRSS